MERNLTLYRLYQIGVSFYAWMPVFFLYFSNHFSLAEVLKLEAIYYVCIFLLEVPSGYFSDRFGRKRTLVISALTLVLSYSAFVFGQTWWQFAAAQVLLAVGLAFNSGTDTSFHHDTLTALGRAHEYGEREAVLSRLTFAVGAVSSLVGGLVGYFDLAWAYVASLGFAGVALASAIGFVEPTHDGPPEGVGSALRESWRTTVRSPMVGWLACFTVGAIVVNHLPYEFYQPFFDAVVRGESDPHLTPVLTGAHAGAVQLLAAVVAGYSVRISRRVGLMTATLAALGIQTLVTASMNFFSPWVMVLALARALPRALHDAPVREALAPRIPSRIRATYLSILSLTGRASFAVVLLGLSTLATDLSTTIALGTAVALGVWITVALWALVVHNRNDLNTSHGV